MLNIYDYYEQPTELPLYKTIYKPLSYFDESIINEWGRSIKKADLDPIVHIIQRSPEEAYQYTIRILKHRWQDAEPYIMKSPMTAFRYAKFVIEGRWEEAEPYIMKENALWEIYKKTFNLD